MHSYYMYAFPIASLVLITYLGGQERLYCTDEYLDTVFKIPSSPFCQISGLTLLS